MRMSRREAIKALGVGALTPTMWLGTRSVWGEPFPTGIKKGYALLIGVDAVNIAYYGNKPVPVLTGCASDMAIYETILKKRNSKKMKIAKLIDGKAIRLEVRRHILWAANDLQDGDFFFVAYSGHGGQVPTPSEEGEADGMDETWCLHDGQLLDDELYFMWRYFRPGVRILVVSDSCNSGTVARVAQSLAEINSDLKNPNSKVRSLLGPGQADRVLEETGTAARNVNAGLIPRESPGAPTAPMSEYPQEETLKLRALPAAYVQDAYLALKPEYDRVKREARVGDARAEGLVAAKGLLLAGCQDGKESWEATGGNGLFTKTLNNVLGKEPKNYDQLFQQILASIGGPQTPNFFRFGNTSDEEFYRGIAPFTVV